MVVVIRNVYWLYMAAIVISIICFLYLAIYMESLSLPEFVCPFWLFIAVLILYTPLHEFLHYVFAYLYNPSTRIRFFPKLLVLVTDYISLDYREWINVILAPQIFIGIPLAITTILFMSKDFIYLLALHILASIVDYISLAILIIHVSRHGKPLKICMLYDEDENIIGGIFESIGGDLYVYLLEE